MALDEKRDLTFDRAVDESASTQSEVRSDGNVSLEERHLVRKLDRRILPIACLMYLFACPYFGDSMLVFWTYSHDVRPGQKQPG
jgi:hypothetical protein